MRVGVAKGKKWIVQGGRYSESEGMLVATTHGPGPGPGHRHGPG